MSVTLAILTTLIAGLPVAIAIDRRLRGASLVGVAFLCGTLLVYFAELGFALAGIEWTRTGVTAAVLAIAAISMVVSRRRLQAGDPMPRVELHPIDVVTVVASSGYAFIATAAPPWPWDFWAIWGLKGRVFLGSGTIDWSFLSRPENQYSHPDYPLLLPLNYAFAGLTGGGWSDRWLGFYNLAFGLALVLIVRHLAADEAKPWQAAVIALASTGFAFTSFVGLAEGPLIAFGGAGLLFLRRGVERDDRAAVRLGALLLGSGALCKNEGLALLVAAVIVLAMTARRCMRDLAPALVPVASWALIRVLHPFASDLVEGGMVSRGVARLEHVARFLRMLLVELPDRAFWIVAALALLVVPLAQIRRERLLLAVSALQLACYVAVYVVSPHDLRWHVATSWPRLPAHVATPVLFAVMLMLARTFGRSDDLAHAEARSDR